MRSLRLSLILMLLPATLLLAAANLVFKPVVEESSVKFVAYTPLFEVEGVFHKWSAQVTTPDLDPTHASVSVEIKTESLDTGIFARDNHLRSKAFLWAEKHPLATFKSTKIEKLPDGRYQMAGEVNIRGVQEKIAFPVSFLQETKDKRVGYRIKGQFTVNRHHFGIDYKSPFFLPEVKDDVDIKLDVLLTKS